MATCFVCSTQREVMRELQDSDRRMLDNGLTEIQRSSPILYWCDTCRKAVNNAVKIDAKQKKFPQLFKSKSLKASGSTALMHVLQSRQTHSNSCKEERKETVDEPEYPPLLCILCRSLSKKRVDELKECVDNDKQNLIDLLPGDERTAGSPKKKLGLFPDATLCSASLSSSNKMYSGRSTTAVGSSTEARRSYGKLYNIATVRKRYINEGEQFVAEVCKRRRLLGETISEDVLRKIIRPECVLGGGLCLSHLKCFESVQKDNRKKKCTVCKKTFPQYTRFCKLTSAFDEFDSCSKLLAVESLLSFLSVAERQNEEKMSFLSEDVSEELCSWQSQLRRTETLEEGIMAFGSLQPDTLDSHVFSNMSPDELQELRALSILRAEFACAKCFLMIKRKCHPSMRTVAPCRVQKRTSICTPESEAFLPIPLTDSSSIHEYYMSKACEVLMSKLEKPGSYCYSKEAFDIYVQFVLKAEDLLPKCQRTFERYVMSNYKLVAIRSTARGRGTALMTPESAVHLLNSSSKLQSSDYLASPTLRGYLLKVAEEYQKKDMKERFQCGQWSIEEEMKRFPPDLWRYFWMALESPKDTFERSLAENAVNGDVSRLSWPYSNGPAATTQDFLSLSHSRHRKCLRIFSVLQHLVLCVDGAAAGPFIWGLSICALLHGSKFLITLLNTLGYTKSYDTLRRLRNEIAKAEQCKELRRKVVNSLLLKVAWDNLDARVPSNVVRLVGKSLDWHGTVIISTQMPYTSPLTSSKPFRTICREEFPTPMAVVDKFVEHTPAVRAFNVMFQALVAVFRQNLFSKQLDSMVSIDFLLRLALKGRCSGKAANISNLLIADMVSNSEATAAYVMREMQAVTELQSKEDNDPQGVTRYCAMVADCPLFRLVLRIIHDTLDGGRNPEFSRIIPVIGHMHLAICFQQIVKFVLWDAGMDCLASGAGLSDSLIKLFRDRKEYKTNLRFFRQNAVVWSARVQDVLFDDGDLLETMPALSKFKVKRSSAEIDTAPSLEEMLMLLKHNAKESGNASKTLQESLRVDPTYFGAALEDVGEEILRIIDEKCAKKGDVNFIFFARDGLLNLISPSLCLYYLSRAAQIEGRQQAIWHMMPYAFTTRKTNYMQTLVTMMHMDLTIPLDIHEKLYMNGSLCTNILGVNEFGNLDDDEANEMTGVRTTKVGASHGTFSSLSTSFSSSQVLASCSRKLQSVLKVDKSEESDIDEADNGKNRLTDGTKKECYNYREMYFIAIGRRSQSKLAMLGPEHRASAVLCNPLSADNLSLSENETARMLHRYDIGKAGLADLYGRRNHPFRKPGDPKNATRKNIVGGFASARDERAQSTEEKARKFAIAGRAKAMAAASKAIIQINFDLNSVGRNPLTTVQQKMQTESMENRISGEMDILTPRNLAMRDGGKAEEPRNAHKSEFFPALCSTLCTAYGLDIEHDCEKRKRSHPITKCPPFFLKEFSPLPLAQVSDGRPTTQIIAAVDVSNVMHYPVQDNHKMFLSLHAEHLAGVCVDQVIRTAQSRNITCLELHIDDPTRVPKQKAREQRNRDNSRQDGAGIETESSVLRKYPEARAEDEVIIEMFHRVPESWKSRVLGNRQQKAKWGNALKAATARRCVEKMSECRCACLEINIYGSNIDFSEAIISNGVADYKDIVWTVMESGEAFVHLKYEDVDKYGGDDADEQQNRSKCWSIKMEQVTPDTGYKVRVYRSAEKDCTHGESETRMQFTLSQELQARSVHISKERTTVLQISRDSDNICLAMFSAYGRGLSEAGKILVKIGQSQYDIRMLLASLRTAGIDPISIGRLYSLAGNDFQPGCAVATNAVLVRIYCHLHENIGKLDTAESVQTLFYYAFACALSNTNPPSLPVVLQECKNQMTSEWKLAARQYIFLHRSTRTMSDLLPQDTDLILTHRRGNLFVTNEYWLPASNTRNHTNLPMGPSVGFDESGDPLLEMQSDMQRRQDAIKYRNSKCGCGKQIIKITNASSLKNGLIQYCCQQNSRCGCVKKGRICLSRCGCNHMHCTNSPGGSKEATKRIEEAHKRVADATKNAENSVPASLSHIINRTDESLGTIEEDANEEEELDDPFSGNDSQIEGEKYSGFSESDSDEEVDDENRVPGDDFIVINVSKPSSSCS